MREDEDLPSAAGPSAGSAGPVPDLSPSALADIAVRLVDELDGTGYEIVDDGRYVLLIVEFERSRVYDAVRRGEYYESALPLNDVMLYLHDREGQMSRSEMANRATELYANYLLRQNPEYVATPIEGGLQDLQDLTAQRLKDLKPKLESALFLKVLGETGQIVRLVGSLGTGVLDTAFWATLKEGLRELELASAREGAKFTYEQVMQAVYAEYDRTAALANEVNRVPLESGQYVGGAGKLLTLKDMVESAQAASALRALDDPTLPYYGSGLAAPVLAKMTDHYKLLMVGQTAFYAVKLFVSGAKFEKLTEFITYAFIDATVAEHCLETARQKLAEFEQSPSMEGLDVFSLIGFACRHLEVALRIQQAILVASQEGVLEGILQQLFDTFLSGGTLAEQRVENLETEAEYVRGVGQQMRMHMLTYLVQVRDSIGDVQPLPLEPTPEGDTEGAGLFPIRERGKVGYIDVNGNVVIPPRFHSGSEFSEGRAVVLLEPRRELPRGRSSGGKYAYINTKGEPVTGAVLEEAGRFSEGLAYVENDARRTAGYIDTSSQFSIVFRQVAPRQQPRAPRQQRPVGRIRSAGKGSGPAVGAAVPSEGSDFSEGLARVLFAVGPGGRARQYGYIDTDFKTSRRPAIPALFDEAGDFSDGLARVRNAGGPWFYIDQTGERVFELPPECERARDFHEGLAVVAERRGQYLHYYYIDKQGRKAFKDEFDDAGDFSEGLAWYRDGLDNRFYIDKEGRRRFTLHFRVSPNYGDQGRDPAEEWAETWGHVEPSGEVNIHPHNIRRLGDLSEGLARVELSHKWGYADKGGEIVIYPWFDDAGDFNNGLARVTIGDHWGYISKVEQVVWATDRAAFARAMVLPGPPRLASRS